MPAYLDLMPDEELKVNPRWLLYNNDYSVPQKVILCLENAAGRPVAYRLRANHPEYFRARHGRGVIAARAHTFVEIYLLEIYQWSELERNQHRLLIESLYLPEGEQKSPNPAVWTAAKVTALFEKPWPPQQQLAGGKCEFSKPMPCYFKIPVVLPRPIGDEHSTGPSNQVPAMEPTDFLMQDELGGTYDRMLATQTPPLAGSSTGGGGGCKPTPDDNVFFTSVERSFMPNAGQPPAAVVAQPPPPQAAPSADGKQPPPAPK